MRSILVSYILLLILFAAQQGSASLAIYEAGKAAICIDDTFEKEEIVFSFYPTIYFEPVTSREQVRNNEYTLIINKIGVLTDRGVILKPIRIMISDNPFDPNTTFSFVPSTVKTVLVGRLGLINTTLYAGSWSEQTPHFVTFTEGNFSCCIYGQDIEQYEIEDFLKRIDVLNKSNLDAFLPLLWTE
jgi:hypothetical protein